MYYDICLKNIFRFFTKAVDPPDLWSPHWLSHGSPSYLEILKPFNGGVYASSDLMTAFFLGLRHRHPEKNVHWGSYQLNPVERRYFLSVSRETLQTSAIYQPIFIHLCDPESFAPIQTKSLRVTRYSSGIIKGPSEFVSTSAVMPRHILSMQLSDFAVSAHPSDQSRLAAFLLYRWRLSRYMKI